jgi:hypothetical protein
MATAYSSVPMPIDPPSSQPAASTVSSMVVRTRRIDAADRATSPVISPSRGPGPSRAPMYSPVATPLSSTPPARNTTRTASAPGVGSRASAASTLTPRIVTLATVPAPGRRRSGTQASSTSAPTPVTTQPKRSPVRWARPWWNTSHGSRPSRASTIIAMLTA